MSAPLHVSRRRFVQTVATAGIAGPTILSSLGRGAPNSAPSDRLNVGFIGIGRQGRGHLQRFAGYADVQVVAVCDVVAERRDDAKQLVEKQYAKQSGKSNYQGCDTYNDFRELLARKDIDAVLIATPDHWHAIPAIAAARAGKDIYCEKPLTRTIAEGRALVTAVNDAKVIFQTGSQQRTEFGGRFRQAVELVRNGYLGDIKTVRIGVGGPAVACNLPTEPVPAGTDWNLWQGPAVERGYNKILCPQGVHGHFPAWRAYKEYAGGALADMGAHHFDIAQWALGTDGTGPTSIEPPSDPGATTGLKFTYASGIEMFHGGPNGCTFEGTKGTLYVDRPKIESTPAEIATRVIGPDEKHVYHADNHHRDWLDCIRSRKTPICSAEIGHRSCTICLLGNIGYWLRRPLTWDPVKEQFVGDDEANKLVLGEICARPGRCRSAQGGHGPTKNRELAQKWWAMPTLLFGAVMPGCAWMSKHVRVRFSLGTLLALTALLAILFARVSNNERRVRAFKSLALSRLPLAPRATSDFVGRALLAILGDDELGSRLSACSNDVWYIDLAGELTPAMTASLADLPEVRELHFQNAHITDQSLANLRSFVRLKKLYLGPWAGSFKQSDITDMGVRALGGLTDLEVLDLQTTAVTDVGLQSLAGLASLKELYLGQTLVTDAGMESLKKLPALEILVLDGTAVTDQGVGRVSKLPKLEQIGLEETKITDEAISYLILAPCLKQVRFDVRCISRDTYGQMRELRPDIDLDSPPRRRMFGGGMF